MVLLAGVALAQTPPTTLAIGAKVPPLEGSDVDGEPLQWQRWQGRAVVLLFHAHDARFASKALRDIAKTCKSDKELRDVLTLLVVTNSEAGATDVREALAKTGLAHAITIDADRHGFTAYRAVAFPTVFTIGREQRIVHVARGPSPLLAVKVRAAARFAAGLIDRKQFESALQPAKRVKGERRVRVANLVEQLLGRESYAGARRLVTSALKKAPDDPRLLELSARLELAQGDGKAAAVRIAQLEKVNGRNPQSRQLRAELLLLQNDAEAALAELEGLPQISVRSALLKGRVLEKLGRHQEAASVYRRALQRQQRRREQ